jgi:hypothetical protein
MVMDLKEQPQIFQIDHLVTKLNEFTTFNRWYNSFEQLWIQVIMLKKYNKIWNPKTGKWEDIG